MRNPFLELGKPKIENPQGEEVSGTFFCQDQDCHDVTNVARYIPEVQLLTWKPKCGHIGKIEGFQID